MARVLILGAVIPFVLSLAPAAPVPKHLTEPVYYYPTRVGAEWVYSCELHSTDRISYRQTRCTVTAVERRGETWLVTTAINPDPDEGLPSREVMLVSDGRLTEIECNGNKFDPPRCLLKPPLKRGLEWEETREFLKHEIHIRRTIQEPAIVVVPVGRFHAVPVTESGRIADSRTEGWSWTHWYAPGVGCIKSTSSSGTAIVLKSFTPGKD